MSHYFLITSNDQSTGLNFTIAKLFGEASGRLNQNAVMMGQLFNFAVLYYL